MSISRRFTQLAKRLHELRDHLLPKNFSPTGQYTDKEYDLARAYLVLVHAEIEAYCEDRAGHTAHRAQQLWQKKRRHSAVLMRLLRFHHATTQKPWVQIDKSAPKIVKAFNYYTQSVIGQNHGIREENLAKMLHPIGIDPVDLDNVWLTIMDSFGASRGAIAHTSIKMQRPVDPETEFKRITKQILPGLRKLDRKIGRL